MPKTKIKVRRERWRVVRVHELYYNELVEICKIIELPLAQCIAHVIHDAYTTIKAYEEVTHEKASEKVSKQIQEKAVKTQARKQNTVRIPPPPP
jgi:hypothetical protein